MVKTRLSDVELARLDSVRGALSRSAYLRSVLSRSEGVKGSEAASHAEALLLLSELARGGNASAAVALERALRRPRDAVERARDELTARRRSRGA